ncbi:MAG: hypothetical protein RIS35_2395 [Pseudomonadota bacterium]
MTDARDLAPGTLVQHWKGGLYRVETLAVREADGEAEVVYRPLSDPARRAWTRPLAGFVEPVADGEGGTRPRFVPVPLADDRALRAACAATQVPAPLVEQAVARYAEPQRHYHASWHVFDVFARAAARGWVLDRAQALALLWHDAVYVAGAAAGSNEAMSALLLRQCAAANAGPDAPHAQELDAACAMIGDTAGHLATVPGSDTVIALDLATLADPAPRFDVWTELVWLEYRHLFIAAADPKAAFLARRLRVLAALRDAVKDAAMPEGFVAAFSANVARFARRIGG